MSIYKLYGTGVTDNLASLDIVMDGTITGVQWAATGDLDADAETYAAELSFSSASGFTTNDTKSGISTIRQFAADTGTATSNKLTGTHVFVGPGLNIPVKQGERLYLHGSGTSLTVTCHIYVDDRAGGGRPSGRRVRL